jgi:hypothetical protein
VIQLKSSSLSSLLDRTVSFVPNFFFLWKISLQSFGLNSIGKEPSIKSPKLALESRTFGAVGIN